MVRRQVQAEQPQGEIIITLQSDERHFQYDQLGLSFDSTDQEVLDAVAPVILEETGLNIKEEGDNGELYTVKSQEASQNKYLFPKSVAGK